nr:MAG TPA_asm: hypothetical protein [Caudoviricetes sp.]
MTVCQLPVFYAYSLKHFSIVLLLFAFYNFEYFYVFYVFYIDITYYTCYYILVRRKQYK